MGMGVEILSALARRWTGSGATAEYWSREAQDAWLSRLSLREMECLLRLTVEELALLTSASWSMADVQARAALGLLADEPLLADVLDSDFSHRGILACPEWDFSCSVSLNPAHALPWLLVGRSLEALVQRPLVWHWRLGEGPERQVALEDLWSFLCGHPATLPEYPLVWDQGDVWLLHRRHAVKLYHVDLRFIDTMTFLLDRLELPDRASVCADLEDGVFSRGLPTSLRDWEALLRREARPLPVYKTRSEIGDWVFVSSRPLSQYLVRTLAMVYSQVCAHLNILSGEVEVSFGGPLSADLQRVVLPNLCRTTPHGMPFRGLLYASLKGWAVSHLKSWWDD